MSINLVVDPMTKTQQIKKKMLGASYHNIIPLFIL